MDTTITRLGLALTCCAALTFCSQPEQAKETTPEAENHAAHTATVTEGANIIAAQAEPDTLKGSLKAEAHGMIGDAHLTINYHSPAVRGRNIWGGLVAYNQVWVTGAHSATSLTVDKDIMIGDEKLVAGKYAFFTIPGEQEWTIIINKNYDQHLADDYAETEDVLRLKVTPETVAEHQERLRYEIVPGKAKEGAIVITWDKLKVSVPVKQV